MSKRLSLFDSAGDRDSEASQTIAGDCCLQFQECRQMAELQRPRLRFGNEAENSPNRKSPLTSGVDISGVEGFAGYNGGGDRKNNCGFESLALSLLLRFLNRLSDK